MEATMTERLRHAASDALQVQDACNISGVVFAFARHMQTLCDAQRDGEGRGTDWRALHPVTILFVDKLRDMIENRGADVFKAYDECKRLAS